MRYKQTNIHTYKHTNTMKSFTGIQKVTMNFVFSCKIYNRTEGFSNTCQKMLKSMKELQYHQNSLKTETGPIL